MFNKYENEMEHLIDIYNAYVEAALEADLLFMRDKTAIASTWKPSPEGPQLYLYVVDEDKVAFLMQLQDEILDYTYLIGGIDND